MKMPTEQQIRDAAQQCPEAKRVLEQLFPDVFEEKNPLVGPLSFNSQKCQGREHFVGSSIPAPNIWYLEIDGIIILHTEKNHPDKIFLGTKYCWKLNEMASGRQFIEIKK